MEVFMRKVTFSELINISSVKKMAENIYNVAGISFSIVDVDGTINIAIGWQDICTKFHRTHPVTCKRCLISDQYINEHLKDAEYISYKCLNNMWDIAVPIIVAGEHLATIFFGQFFYENEEIDMEYFRMQALQFGFDEKEYLDALSRVPILSKEKVENIMEYYSNLVVTLAESGLRQLEYMESQNELKKSQKYLNAIFNSVSDAIFIQDFSGNIADVNETAISMFGYSRYELLAMNVRDIALLNTCSPEFSMKDLINRLDSKNSFIVELIGRKKCNTEFWIEVNLHIANIDENKKIVVTVRDITGRKQAELALRNETIEIEKLRTEFFANISHELRTPLNIILGAIQMIKMFFQDEEKPIDRKKIINYIDIERQNCFRLLRLINNLIDSTRFDSGHLDLNMVNCNIVNIVEEITLSVAQYINSNDITLTFDTEMEEKIIACDLDKIERIMLNLLSNATKFTSSGGNIYVNILDGEEYITISVEDTGIGIPEDKLEVIFDRFRQVDKSFTRNCEGSGIGLYLVKSLVEIQGGTITVESIYGRGTQFFIKLPVVKAFDKDKSEDSSKFVGNMLNNNVERIKVEFSDVYK
jgi:PAS domain S-box-containing protein